MVLVLDQVLTPEAAADVSAKLASARFVDGKTTAGWHAKNVKTNRQAAPDDAIATAVRGEIEAALRRHPVFTAAALPKSVQLAVNQYRVGDAYGRHVDDAFVNGRRADVSLTVFLGAPDSYDGGELVIETTFGEQALKLPAGSAVLYPTTTLHRVESVTRGERLACIGWVESRVRDAGKREILFDLDRARRAIFQSQGKTSEFDLLAKVTSNLLRRWGE